MPVAYNLPAPNQAWTQQEVDRYNKLPFYLALQQAKYFPKWQVWNKLLETTPWQPNMGTTMKGVILEPSPIQRTFFSPNPLTSAAKKDIISQYERTNSAVLYHHKFESPQFNFLPSYQDFRRKQIQAAQQDINNQIVCADDFFARGIIFHGSPYMFISGKGRDSNGALELVSAPVGLPNDDATLAGKTTNYMQQMVALVGNNRGNLSFKTINKAYQVLSNDIGAPAFEGMQNTPKDNEVIKGNYVIVGGKEAFENLKFDEHILTYKPLMTNLINDEFSGQIGNVVYKTERFPIRVAADGTFPFPQRYEANADAYNAYETVPNPDWVNAPFEIAHIMGAGSWDKITVGPPPSEFASGKISESKLNKLFWNGEVKITDQVLVQIGVDANSVPVLDTNKYGEYLQLISRMVFGQIAVNRRYAVPILFRRWRVETT